MPLKFEGLSEFINQNCRESINTIFTDLSRLTEEKSSPFPYMNPSEIRRTVRITKTQYSQDSHRKPPRKKEKEKKKLFLGMIRIQIRRTVGIHKSNRRENTKPSYFHRIIENHPEKKFSCFFT
jgi:hypothetical protein